MSADRCKMSGTCSRATDRRNDATARTVLQSSWNTNIHSLESANILHKDFSDYILSFFLIIFFAADTSHLHINSISYVIFMRDSPVIFYDIINVYLELLCSGYNSPF